MSNNYLDANKALWEELTEINVGSAMYDLEGFKQGAETLDPIEIEELGHVKGKLILHLQCQFGQDAISLARKGAVVTGVDFSEKAIALAKSLSAELNVPADFVCCNIYDLPQRLDKEFDIVFTSGGVLCWLPDLTKWAQLINRVLKPGGFFYIREFHPVAAVFSNDSADTELKARYSYFHQDQPQKWDDCYAYADHSKKTKNPSYEWQHPLADVVSSLLAAGLRIEFLHEFSHCSYDCFPFLEKGADGRWRFPGGKDLIPLMFSLKALKPVGGGI
ncbi:class I SAM-dependent methyltransferase [candidate division TA06 bacterium]|uniref:Class I SAM-dependent methyltransferase n=1 Tax=candidate division TA06 bacterium TaxID=2250710 RepID=A0A933IAM6_UNCT6|nr:class I SAM-dependent methyltransferase [candidate division TA06 bacterium]